MRAKSLQAVSLCGPYLSVRVLAWLTAILLCTPTAVGDERPNVLLLVADDLGYSDLGCYGSEIPTPSLDSLAAAGTVFSDFHTASTCSPTRAMLLTGVDHHQAGMGNMYEFLRTAPEQIGKPGYEGHLNASVMTFAQVLRLAGYETSITGKWHLGQRLVTSQAPIARGFDNSWVLWSGWAAHVQPQQVFVEGNRRVRYPRGRYSTDWYTDKAIEFADKAINQDKPFFLFLAYTAPHWPLEAPPELIAKHAGKYDRGYDALRERRIAGLVERGIFPRGVRSADNPAQRPQLHHAAPREPTRRWQELSETERQYSSRLMEVHAAMVESLDQNIGRLFEHLKGRDQFQNTLIIFLSDNGASSLATQPNEPGNQLENVGLPGSFVGYGPEWARACSGPLRLLKGYATEGGTRVPAIVKLPGNARQRASDEFATALDIAPTIYELSRTKYPPPSAPGPLLELDGESLLPYLSGDSNRIHSAEYSMGWELFGRTAFRKGKWKITWTEEPFGIGAFELFDIEADPGESEDLRATFPEVYQQMLKGFDEYRKDNGVVIARPEHW